MVVKYGHQRKRSYQPFHRRTRPVFAGKRLVKESKVGPNNLFNVGEVRS